MPKFGYAIYKLSAFKKIFNDNLEVYIDLNLPGEVYLDYRDIYYPIIQSTPPEPLPLGNPYSNQSNDITIMYDAELGIFLYYPNVAGTNSIFNQMQNFSYFPLWKIKNLTNHIPFTNYFPNYWQNCLVVVNDGNNHPHLVWGTYPAQVDLAGYRIYRRIDGGNFTPIYTTATETEIDYIDNSITLGAGAGTAYYYVKALYSTDEESEATNTVSVLTNQNSSLKTLPELLENKPIEYSLEQNYPNPFNPSTLIKFTLPQSEFVKIIVFNQMGEQVALLANEQMSSGTHSINFDGTDLASGIYFYQISAGKFNEVRKMMLLK